MTLTQSFLVTLAQDVILSRNAATAGQHQSLDYLPGAVFLGIAASRGYQSLAADDAWTLFHSGKVRFVDALPWQAAQLGRPMPLSLHAYKGTQETLLDRPNQLDASMLFDPASADIDPARQPKQLRKGYLTDSGLRVLPNLTERMKTAIDHASGRAAMGQLFGYQALCAGQQFLFTLQADDDAQGVFELAKDWLTGKAQIGRSRSAQYGGVEISPSANVNLQPSSTSNEHQLTLWLLTDLALLDQQGQPCLHPSAAVLNLPPTSQWCSDKSYLRTRRYSAYNAKRRCFDPEREVISRGSVLRYELTQPLAHAELVALQQLGLYQESGLGQIAVNPQLLVTDQPVFKPMSAVPATAISPLAAPTSPLIALLQKRAGQTNQQQDVALIAGRLFAGLCLALEQARSWRGVPANQPLTIAPGRSQWGQLKSLASDQRQRPTALWKQLFEADNAMIRARSGWDLDVGPGRTLNDAMRALCQQEQLQHHAQLGEIIGRLAVLGMSAEWHKQVNGTRHQKPNGVTQ
jgi:hypothetical protein